MGNYHGLLSVSDVVNCVDKCSSQYFQNKLHEQDEVSIDNGLFGDYGSRDVFW